MVKYILTAYDSRVNRRVTLTLPNTKKHQEEVLKSEKRMNKIAVPKYKFWSRFKIENVQ
jgi:hypothetical protein